MTTTDKTLILHNSSDVFDASSSYDEEGLDNHRLPTPNSFKAGEFRPPSCNSLARTYTLPFHRRPASFRRRVRTCFTTGAILTAVLLDRVSYFSIVGNLVLFCTNVLGLSSNIGVTVDLVFIGQSVCYMFYICLLYTSPSPRD